ncbi:hypothetical protein EB796_018381 [Bugula neritina]|uniref:Uncharacterized protein n=1 Tax=Bugula neritina TaxID=10212 RepID=A0A7J7JCF4_BUGNE|nr:hypothetical protein EB796_018381 [Bugula neritina]
MDKVDDPVNSNLVPYKSAEKLSSSSSIEVPLVVKPVALFNSFKSSNKLSDKNLFNPTANLHDTLLTKEARKPINSTTNIFESKSALSSSDIASSQPFGKPVTTASVFGATSSEAVKTSANSSANIFGSISAFGSPAVSTSQPFGKPVTTTSSFGSITSNPAKTSANSTTNIFGSKSVFSSSAITASQPFGKLVTTASIFGATSSEAVKTSANSSANIFGSNSAFGSSAVSTSQPFGKPATTTSSFGSITSDLAKTSANFTTNIFDQKVLSAHLRLLQVNHLPILVQIFLDQIALLACLRFGSITSDPAKTSANSTTNIFGSKSAFSSSAITASQPFGKLVTTTSIFGVTSLAAVKTSANSSANIFGSNNAFGSSAVSTSQPFGKSVRALNTGAITEAAKAITNSWGSELFKSATGSQDLGATQFLAGTAPSGTYRTNFVPTDGRDNLLKNGLATTVKTKHYCITGMKFTKLIV